jgi:hypothetical protein
MVSAVRTVPASAEFVDIAGLVKGASKGEGLGNQFLATIRECDALVQVGVRLGGGWVLLCFIVLLLCCFFVERCRVPCPRRLRPKPHHLTPQNSTFKSSF